MNIHSLAAMRRAVSTPGVRIEVVEHWQPHLRGTSRTPDKVQNNGYRWLGTNRDGKVVQLWCHYPKASELAFNDDGTVTFHPGTEKSWRLRFVA